MLNISFYELLIDQLNDNETKRSLQEKRAIAAVQNRH